MEENKKKKTIIFSVIAVVILLVAVVGITYAYFSADTTGNTGNVDVNAETAKQRDVFSTSGEPTISLDVTSDKMQYADKGSVAVSDTKTMSVSLEAGSGKATCTYDLTYIPDVAFAGSGLDNELTLEGSNGSKSFGPIDIKGSSNVNLGSFKIIDEYENPSVVTSETWTLTGKFNNLDADQNNSINKTFSGRVQATNVVCKNSLEEEESKIQILNGGDIDTIGTEVAIGDEHFYVIESNDNEVELLSKYNLLVGSDYSIGEELIDTHTSSQDGYNMQSEDARGVWCEDLEEMNNCSITSPVPFASEVPYWWDNAQGKWSSEYTPKAGQTYPYVYDKDNEYNIISEYVENYKEILETEYDIEVEDAKLMSFEQAIALGCDKDEQECISAPSWVWGASYWLGSAKDGYDLWTVDTFGYFSDGEFDHGMVLGVRPVIVLDKSLFE